MANRRIYMHEYRQVIYRLRQGQSCRAIAKEMQFGRNKVQEVKVIAESLGWLNLEVALPEEDALLGIFGRDNDKHSTHAKALPYAHEIERWVQEGITATIIHQHLINNYSYKGAYNSVQRFVQKIKAKQNLQLTVPLTFHPGEAAQVDFGKGPKLYDERVGEFVETWFFVMTLCFSRHQYVELVTHQDIETWLTCHQNAFNWFGGVVGKIIIDNPKCAVTKACYYDPTIQKSYEAFAESYGFIISACPPRDPKKKGRVESGVKYVKRNFLPLKDFRSLQDGNRQLKTWVLAIAGERIHGTTFEKPLALFATIEKNQLKPLPATQPEIAVWQKVKLYRDCHVRLNQCLYSVPHQYYGKELWAKMTARTITIYHQHIWIASHPRLFKAGKRNTLSEHLPPQARAYLQRDASWCLEKSEAIGQHCHFVIENLLTDPCRDLLRQAQGILGLTKAFGEKRLELACQRALQFQAANYKTIKTILQDGLENELTTTVNIHSLSPIYQGHATYQRHFENHLY